MVATEGEEPKLEFAGHPVGDDSASVDREPQDLSLTNRSPQLAGLDRGAQIQECSLRRRDLDAVVKRHVVALQRRDAVNVQLIAPDPSARREDRNVDQPQERLEHPPQLGRAAMAERAPLTASQRRGFPFRTK